MAVAYYAISQPQPLGYGAVFRYYARYFLCNRERARQKARYQVSTWYADLATSYCSNWMLHTALD